MGKKHFVFSAENDQKLSLLAFKIKIGFVVLCIIGFASCSYNTLDGRGRITTFVADASVFADTTNPTEIISYHAIHGLKGNNAETLEFKPEQPVRVIISQPTFFLYGDYEFLVYPGNNIRVSGNRENPSFASLDGNSRRDSELQLLKRFRELERWPIIHASGLLTFDSVIHLEQEQRQIIPQAEATAQLLFDSLQNAYGVSKKFKRLTINYVTNRYVGNLLWVYRLSRDTLSTHGLYRQKLHELVLLFNNLSSKRALTQNMQRGLNNLLFDLFPGNLMWSLDSAQFERCFDSIRNNFNGPARDYLLSRLMQRAAAIGLSVPTTYQQFYRAQSNNRRYRKIIRNTAYERLRKTLDTTTAPNTLLAVDGKTTVPLEQVIAAQTGKYVVIDVWASWCVPCLQEMPHLAKLKEQYTSEQVSFLALSTDKLTSPWQRTILDRGLEKTSSYRLLNSKAAFYKQYQLSTLPRYIIIDRKGNVINSNAPSPGDPALKALLDSLLARNGEATKSF